MFHRHTFSFRCRYFGQDGHERPHKRQEPDCRVAESYRGQERDTISILRWRLHCGPLAAAAAAAAYLQPLIFADLTRLGVEDEDGVEEVEMMC